MGEHFLQIPPDAGNDFNCTSGTPLFQILYSGGALTGFVFTHFAEIPSMASLRYENPHYNILGELILFQKMRFAYFLYVINSTKGKSY